MTSLKNMRITHKISALMIGLVMGFIVIGVTYYIQINLTEKERSQEHLSYEYKDRLSNLNSLSLELQISTNANTTSIQGSEQTLYADIFKTISTLKTFEISAPDQKRLSQVQELAQQHKNLIEIAPVVDEFFLSPPETGSASDGQGLEATNILGKIRESIATLSKNADVAISKQVEKSSEQAQITQAAVTGIIFFVAMATAVGIYLLYKSIVFPLVHMQSVIRRINRGKTSARVKILSQDELGDLGLAFNKLLDERINQLEQQSKENDVLNNSIISLIKALGSIANKDLTVKVPVSSDITGTISDAVNLLTKETAKTLQDVKGISHEVNDVSNHLQEQSQLVMQFADNERRHIAATSKALQVLSNAMNDVASHSEQASQSANQAIDNTRSARGTVNQTVSGIRTIRETISETEKRMKRLGERSQEISGIVNLINTIAERTHILALNASMHAASAGEAGKGFAVVAEEVQRLAESARTSTEEISTMVNNMRVETADTATVMNTLISQVAEGSRMAEEAGKQMEATETTTEQLVSTVKRIAEQAITQADVASRVKDRSNIIRGFTEKTGKQLKEQHIYTENLKSCAETLVKSVNVFNLPDDSGSSSKDASKQNTHLVSVG